MELIQRIIHDGNGRYTYNKNDYIAWLKKQIEQKHADKIEPKFKVGDIIKHNKANIIYKVICKTISVDSRSYYVENIMTGGRIELSNAEQNYHLWTIQDAKDGDVLVNKYGAIFINAGSSNERGTVDCYCYLSVQNEFFIEDHKTGSWLYKETLKPATKEQCDLLFSKMKESGYEWDAEKKELKKIEPTLAWDEEDEKMCKNLLFLMEQENSISSWEGCYEWLKSLEERVQLV
jgi:hypothetical protein